MFLVRITIEKRAGGRFFFGYLLFPIYMLSLHNITFPRDTLDLAYHVLSSNKDTEKRHLSILTFCFIRQRRTKYKVKDPSIYSILFLVYNKEI